LPGLYFAEQPNQCFLPDGVLYYRVYVDAPGGSDITGVSFDLDLHGTTLFPVVVGPVGSVSIAALDVSTTPYHIEAYWPSQPLVHEPILFVQFFSDPLLNGVQTPRNVEFFRGGAPEPGKGVWSFAGCCVDCLTCGHAFYGPGLAEVPVESSSVYDFQWGWFCWAAGGDYLTVTDTEGWVTSWSPTTAVDAATCGMCVIPRHPGVVDIYVPEGVAVGTTSTMTIAGASGSNMTVTLEAVEPVATRNTTWGALKALFE